MKRGPGLLILSLVAIQTAASLGSMFNDANKASFESRRQALTTSQEDRLDQALGAQAKLYRRLTAALGSVGGQPAVVYLLPSEGLPTDLEELSLLQRRYGTPLAALLQPASVRLLGPDLSPGPLVGDEALFVVEIGPHHERAFMSRLVEFTRDDRFRIYRLPQGAKL